jgi:hypothetical protein
MRRLRSMAWAILLGAATLSTAGSVYAQKDEKGDRPGRGGNAPKAPKVEAPKVAPPRQPKADAPRVAKPEPPRAAKPEAPRAPKVEAPKADVPRAPKADVPRAPRADVPRAPKLDAPKVDVPRQPKADAPRAPKVEAPKPDAPRVPRGDAPKADPPRTPRVDPPKADLPKVPRADAPKVDAPKGDAPGRTPRPEMRPDDKPPRSVETRKPELPGLDKRDPDAGKLPEAAPRPPRIDRGPRNDQAPRVGDRTPDPKGVDNKLPNDPKTPRTPGDALDKVNPKDRNPVNPVDPDKVRDRANDLRDRENMKDARDRANDLRDRDNNPGRDRIPGDRDNRPDRDGIPSGLTKPIDRNVDLSKRPVKQVQIDRADNLARDKQVNEAMRDLRRVRNADDLEKQFDRLRDNDSIRGNARLSALPLDRVSGRFQARVRTNEFDRLVGSRYGQRYNFNQQFGLWGRGDVARQLRLNQVLVDNGGWQRRRVGPIYNNYTRHSFSSWYPGPRWYPSYAWTPRWSPWVAWSFWNNVLPIYDPRPFVVRPYYYDPCPVVTVYEYPVWQPLPVVSSGTWVDVPVVQASSGEDLQLLAVRFVDPGHQEENLGPRYRVWMRNNGVADLKAPMDVTVFASNEERLSDQVVQAGVSIPEIATGDTIAVDVRLPADANMLGQEADGDRIPFTFLHAVVDSRNSLQEADEANNGVVLKRDEIFPVDPAAFSPDVTAAAPGSTVAIAGEGLGPEPGEVIVTMGDEQQSAEIRGWYDLGVQFTIPDFKVNDGQPVQVVIVRGDGTATNPVALDVAPEEMIGTLPQAPPPQASAQ